MVDPAPPATSAGGRLGPNFRLVLGLIVVLVVVLTALALFQSLFIEPRPGVPPGNSPAPGRSTGSAGGAGGGGVKCGDVAGFLLGTTIVLAIATAILFGVGFARRAKNNNRVATSVWGVLGIIGFFLSLLAFGAWRLVDILCKKNLNCQNMTDGTFTVFLVLLSLTLGSQGLAMAMAHRTRRNYFLTGWGIVAIVLYIPTVLAGFYWYIVRFFCTARLSCNLRTEFLATLSSIFWFALVGGAVAIALGILVKRRLKIGFFPSGWGALAIMLLVLSAGAGYGHIQVKKIYIPYCDPPREEQEQNDTIPTCQETKKGIQDRLTFLLWTLVIIALVLFGLGSFFNRHDWTKTFRSGWAIGGYICLVLVFVVLLLLLLTGSMCSGEGGDTSGGTGSRNPGTGGGRNGPPGGGGGGPGGGGGGFGNAPSSVPITLSAIPLVWVLSILGAIVAAALLYLLFKNKKKIDLASVPAPPPPEVDAAERRQLLAFLDQGKLTSHEAVIAAYRSFLAWCAAKGMEKFAYETPLEHAQRVRAQYPVPQDAMRSFIRAYEIARLSSRDPTPQERRFAERFSKDIDRIGWSQGGEKR